MIRDAFPFRIAAALTGGLLLHTLLPPQGFGLGLAAGLLSVALLAAPFWCYRPVTSAILWATVPFLLGLAALIERANLTSLLLTLVGLSFLLFRVCIPNAAFLSPSLLMPIALTPVGPLLAVRDSIRWGWACGRRWKAASLGGSLRPFALPLALGAGFLMIFAAANPIIEAGLRALPSIASPDLALSFDAVAVILLAGLIWPWLTGQKRVRPPIDLILPALPLSARSILGGLVVLNLVFALQNGLDLAVLGAGIRLPTGMTYSAYAHRGAYALMLAAFIAIALLLTFARTLPGPLARYLMLFWTGQCLLMVAFALLRLDAYVSAYSLTLLRLAGAGLIGFIGLCFLIVGRMIAGRKPMGWLAPRLTVAALIAVYGWGLIDAEGLIADFNLAHSREMGGDGPFLDTGYLKSLGPSALPALATLRLQTPDPALQSSLRHSEHLLIAELEAAQSDWRRWSLRGWRLQRRLATTP